VSTTWAIDPGVLDSPPEALLGPYAQVMDRVDIEALVVRLIDQVQLRGYAAEYDVEDPSALRELLWHEAQRRGLRIHTGTVTADEHAVWVYRPKDEESAHQIIEAAK
jgi:hypothetical protein